ncbi:MAG: GC-type dockerin domain-anchored protein [Phycisphaerales bacterium]
MPNSPRTVVVVALLAGSTVVCRGALAQLFDPGTYYNGITYNAGLGFAAAKVDLKNQVFTKIRATQFIPGNTSTHYDNMRVGLANIDRDVDAVGNPTAPNQLVAMYTGTLISPIWDGGNTWNREHTWPQSRGAKGNSSSGSAIGPLYSDPHHLKVADPGDNSNRSNNGFGLLSGEFDPDDNLSAAAIAAGRFLRGEAARGSMYVDTRYALDNTPYGGTLTNGYIGLALQEGNPPYLGTPHYGEPQPMGDLNYCREWHFAQMPSMRERRRNHLINTGYTYTNTVNGSSTTRTFTPSNRNPFVDHPEWVWAIYGNTANSSKLYFGAGAPADGASVVNVDFGRFIAGSGIPTQNLTLNKAGTTPTTFNVTASTNASSSITGVWNAFTSPAGQTRTITVGLVTTATPSLLTGMVTVDNTDLTSAGAGQGSADGDDVVSLQATMLAHANASFAAAGDQNTLTVNFGTVAKNSTTPSQAVTIYNLVSIAGFTAKLDLDSIGGSGSTSVLTTDFAPVLNLNAGSSVSFNASVFTGASEGPYTATYTIVNSDENVPGALVSTSLMLTLNVTIGPPVNLACNDADIVGVGATPGPDGLNTVDDLVNFLSQFFANNLAVADLVSAGGSPPGDGSITVDDLVYFLAQFFSPCN